MLHHINSSYLRKILQILSSSCHCEKKSQGISISQQTNLNKRMIELSRTIIDTAQTTCFRLICPSSQTTALNILNIFIIDSPYDHEFTWLFNIHEMTYHYSSLNRTAKPNSMLILVVILVCHPNVPQ